MPACRRGQTEQGKVAVETVDVSELDEHSKLTFRPPLSSVLPSDAANIFFITAGRFPYPRDVWLRSGGYWQQPANARRNFFIAIFGTAVVMYGWVRFFSERVWYSREPSFWNPDFLINKQFRTGELGIRDVEQGPPVGWKLPGPRQLTLGGELEDPDAKEGSDSDS